MRVNSQRITSACGRLRELRPSFFFNTRLIGFSFLRAWVYLMFLGAAASAMTWDGTPLPSNLYLGSTITLCVVLFGAALFRRFFDRIPARVIQCSGLVITVIGTLVTSSVFLPGIPTSLFCMIGAVMTGFGSGLLDLAYGERYCRIDPFRTSFEVPFAFLIAGFVYLLITQVPSVVGCVVCALLPAISGVILLLTNDEDRSKEVTEESAVNIGAFAWRIGLCACLVGFSDGIVRAAFFSTSNSSVEGFYFVPLALAGVFSFIIISSSVILNREMGLRTTYRTSMLIMALFFMLLPVFTGYPLIEGTIALTGYGTFNVLIWILLVETAFIFKISPTMTFGMGWGMVTFGVLLGSLAGQFLREFEPFSPQTLSLVALLATIAVLISYMFVFKESDMMNIMQPYALKDDGDGQSRQRRFHARVLKAADHYGLTPKETEIALLLAKGRSAVRIQEELYISRGTCTTHLRHIYQKMDVHTKQEFLDLIESELL